jgi:uncharacterized protein (DUF58 family)
VLLLVLLLLLLASALPLSMLQPPFTLSKTGPSSVRAGEAFDYNLVVTFLKDATGVVINDELPAQLTATSTPASWKSITVNNANPSGGEEAVA